jgi:predicted transposase YbfD/YdcC
VTTFQLFFGSLKDPRRTSHSDHPLLTLIAIVLMSMLCGAKGWDDMFLWAWSRRTWLATIIDLSAGVPSADTLRRLMSALEPKAFRQGFEAWARSVVEQMPELHLAIDGKTIRGSERLGLPAVHVVRAFVVNNHLVLGQLATEEKSNEITAIPELLKTLAIKGGLVSIDAMGCQHEIARTIVDGGADYLLAVKDNQPLLRQEIEEQLASRPVPSRSSSSSFHQTEDQAHGRLERRRVWTETRLAKLRLFGEWVEANTIVRVESERHTDQGVSIENRYYLSSRKLTARQAALAIRGHWAIENVCHWSLDVTLGEDACQIADGYAAENLSLVRSLVLGALKRSVGKLSKFEGKKLSMRQTQKVCGWDNESLMELMGALFLVS